MNHKRYRRGFTIIEIIVVIVVIGILAAITFAVYAHTQKQARDTKVRDAAHKVVDAMEIWLSNHPGGSFKGGRNSSAVSDPSNGCIDGTGSGWIAAGYTLDAAHRCTVGDVLTASKLLPVGFFDTLPAENTYRNSKTNLMLMSCNSKWHVLYAVADPTDRESGAIGAYTAVNGGCSWIDDAMSTDGMTALITLES